MSSLPATVVCAELVLRMVSQGGGLPVQARLQYEAGDPYALKVGFRSRDEEIVEWTFARQLMTDGVLAPVGHGDVRLWPDRTGGRQVVCLSLSSPSGAAVFEAPLGALEDFLRRTYEAVPTGSESDHIDVDAELALLMWSGTSD